MKFVMACGTKRYQVIVGIVVAVLVTVMHFEPTHAIADSALPTVSDFDSFSHGKTEFSRVSILLIASPTRMLWANLESIAANPIAKYLVVSLDAVPISAEWFAAILADVVKTSFLPTRAVTSDLKSHMPMAARLRAKVLGPDIGWPTHDSGSARQAIHLNFGHVSILLSRSVWSNSTEGLA